MLLDFNDGVGGGYPIDGLARGPAGNLYGTTFWGGSGTGCAGTMDPYQGCGVLFGLTAAGKEIVLHIYARFVQ